MLLRVGDDVRPTRTAEILADGRIDIFGDFTNADTGSNPTDYGTTMILRGGSSRTAS